MWLNETVDELMILFFSTYVKGIVCAIAGVP